jgi:hypothetical protein
VRQGFGEIIGFGETISEIVKEPISQSAIVAMRTG